MKLPSLHTAEGLARLDQHLLDSSFISGYQPTAADVTVLKQLAKTGLEEYSNIRRWAQTLRSYSREEQESFPCGEPVEMDLACESSEVPASCEVSLGLVFLGVAQQDLHACHRPV
jgi:hypothetical protein